MQFAHTMLTTKLMLFVLLGVGATIRAVGEAHADPTVDATNEVRPNIVLIPADDMGHSDPGFMGSEIATPNLDRLASAGTVFPHFMNHAKCEPSRASLMTGIHFHRQTHDHVTREFRQVTTIAHELRKADYFTACAGKWHLPGQPTDHGFDRFFGLVQGAANHFDPDGRLKLESRCYLHKEFALDGKPYAVTDDGFYSTDAFTDYALRFLNERPEGSRFFLYLAYTAPHWPLQAPAANIRKYENRCLDGWDPLRPDRHENLLRRGMIARDWAHAPADPEVGRWDALSGAQQIDAARCMAVNAAMVDRLDEQIGRVIKHLEDSGELTNTLILFASDNGVSAETTGLTTEYPEPLGKLIEAYEKFDAAALMDQMPSSRGEVDGHET